VGLTRQDSGPESPQHAGALVLPPPTARNAACPCGSGRKYKRCCQQQDEIIHRQLRPTVLPSWLLHSRSKLHQFEKYVWKVFALPELLASLHDSRRHPEIPTLDVVNSLLHTALLRIPSINALEGDLQESDFQKLIGREPSPGKKTFSADTVANVLDKLHVEDVRGVMEKVIGTAERNKAFREGSYGALRCVAIDGWEPFSSYHRHCPHCLVRQLKVKHTDGQVEEVEQFYHRYVVALLLGPDLDVVLAIEPVLNEEVRRDTDRAHLGHEGELTASHRLLRRLYQTYGSFLDVIVVDALYANGPWMTQLDAYGYGGVIVLKKENNEPFKEALALWQGKGPCEIYEDRDAHEHMEFWDAHDIETLDTYQGKVRAIRAVITPTDKPDSSSSTWCFALIGCARKLSRRTALKIIRARWHIENTAFHQWIKYWNLSHVFRHTANALLALLLLWMLAFNLLQFFIYRRLKRPRRPKDPSDTIRHVVEVMLRDVATLLAPIPWMPRLDTS
jgi:SEC-C motif/Transposase DDE domain